MVWFRKSIAQYQTKQMREMPEAFYLLFLMIGILLLIASMLSLMGVLSLDEGLAHGPERFMFPVIGAWFIFVYAKFRNAPETWWNFIERASAVIGAIMGLIFACVGIGLAVARLAK